MGEFHKRNEPRDLPIGTMEGSYFFVAEDGHRFDQPIAAFTLAVPRTLH